VPGAGFSPEAVPGNAVERRISELIGYDFNWRSKNQRVCRNAPKQSISETDGQQKVVETHADLSCARTITNPANAVGEQRLNTSSARRTTVFIYDTKASAQCREAVENFRR